MAPSLDGTLIRGIPESTEQTGARDYPIPGPARERLEKAGIDLSNGYPYYPRLLTFVEDVANLNFQKRDFIDPGSRANKNKRALLGAAKEVIHLTKHIGTEIIGLQLKVGTLRSNCNFLPGLILHVGLVSTTKG